MVGHCIDHSLPEKSWVVVVLGWWNQLYGTGGCKWELRSTIEVDASWCIEAQWRRICRAAEEIQDLPKGELKWDISFCIQKKNTYILMHVHRHNYSFSIAVFTHA